MAFAKLCKCGHNKRDHLKTTTKTRKYYHECEWSVCDCKRFKYEKLESPNAGTNSYVTQLELLIDCCTPHENPNKIYYQKKPPKLLISDCRPDGRHPDFKHTFDNGEYI